MKPGKFTQLYIHLVFVVKHREALIPEQHQLDLWSYISATVTNKKQKAINVNGYVDHVHILIGFNPDQPLTDLVRDIKRSSALYINNQNWNHKKFQWQEGYGAFSHSKSNLQKVYRYIDNQKVHHQKTSLRKEFMTFLKHYEVEYDQRYLFQFFED